MKKEKNILKKIGNDLPFSVPENYFEQFANEIDRQIGYAKEMEVSKSQKRSFAVIDMALYGCYVCGNIFARQCFLFGFQKHRTPKTGKLRNVFALTSGRTNHDVLLYE